MAVVRRVPRRRFGPALVVAMLVLLGGCGDDTAPADAVPELSALLGAVDDAVADRDDAATRAALDDLVRATRDAEDAGELDATDAEAILAAAAHLEEVLPETATPEPTDEESVTQTPSPDEEDEADSDEGDGDGPGHGHGKGKAKGHRD